MSVPAAQVLPAPPPAPAERLARLFEQVRRRRRQQGVRSILLTLSALWLLSGAALVGLAALAGPVLPWRSLAGAWLLGMLLLSLTGLWQRARARESEEAIARSLGALFPDMRSDLLSSIELARDLPQEPLARELLDRTWAALSATDLEAALRPSGLYASRVVALGLLALALGGAVAATPELWRQGVRQLLAPPPDPTQVALEPLVGDLRLLLSYPRYTGLSPRSVPSSSGEVRALPGTVVRIEARALTLVERAQLVLRFDGQPQATRPVQIVEGPEERRAAGRRPLLVSGFQVQKPGSYYFVIDKSRNERVRESEGHRVEVEADRPPRIDLITPVAPSEELEVATATRLEVAYSAEDDYGLGEIDLVFRVNDAPEQRKRIRALGPAGGPGAGQKSAAPQRSAAARILWDLAEIDLTPGARIVYRVEARDLNDVSGPGVGTSRSFTLRVASPRERHDAALQSQDALKEQGIQLLGDRLELTRVEPRAEGGEFFDGLLRAHRKNEALLLGVGRLQEEIVKDAMAPKELRLLLQEIGRRLGKLNQDEEALLGELRGREARRTSRPSRPKDLPAMNERHVGELERDVILLDDLLGRQRLEDLLAISDEIAAARDRLKQLLSDYKKTRSESVRRELEREIREMERRLQELAERAQKLQGDVPQEFLNREAMGQNDLQGRLDRMRDHLQKGELDKVAAELDRLSQSLERMVKGLEQDLRGFRQERFTAEDKTLAEAEDRLADLMHDEQMLKAQTDEIRSRTSAEAQKLLRDRTEPLVRRLQEKVTRLRRQVSDIDTGPLGPWGSDELEKTQKRIEDVGRQLELGDLDEARSMAEEAERSMGRLTQELRAEEQTSRWGAQRGQLGKSRARLEQARPLARELVEDLGRALPQMEELLSPEDRRSLGQLRGQQEALRRQADQLAKDLQKKAREQKDAPLLERMSQEMGEALRKAQGNMEQAEGRLKQLEPRAAAAAEQQALEQMGAMRKQMQQARRPRDAGGGAQMREPVRIPGTEEYRPPREFRQDILDAAKREAPTEYRELVKRYYEELIK